MAIIVKEKETGARFVLLGTGFGAFKAARPGMLLGNLSPTEDKGEFTVLAVSDEKGEVHWIDSDAVVVVEVDGKHPSQYL
ncbi:MAG: hypothetical protein QF415_02545 [Candidatus Undinarchaeales archaeon]|jgi:hypothetical protein|nr:hypothetical protein [Candidatus Undinarchaeales archaeon]MDP7492284.1 hypothetical protein [Candidatus Undinarchaeales archaeon]